MAPDAIRDLLGYGRKRTAHGPSLCAAGVAHREPSSIDSVPPVWIASMLILVACLIASIVIASIKLS